MNPRSVAASPHSTTYLHNPVASPDNRFPGNVPGPFYNDDTCIDCGLCPDLAPGIFRRDPESGQSYVWHQPETPDELALAREAMESCPTETIGEDNGG
jgi:ferredoxin